MQPYYADNTVTLYLGDMREVLPSLDLQPDCIVTDPPYGETSLTWDRWPHGWPTTAAKLTSSMWCFGSMRMFLDRRDEFASWRMSQDVVWEKNAGSSMAADRFKRVHEHAAHWYRGKWREVYHQAQREPERPLWSGEIIKIGRKIVGKGDRGEHLGEVWRKQPWINDGTRLVTSVIRAANLRGRGLHPTEKPIKLLDPLIRYACPEGGLILDPFAGSGATAEAARLAGRRAVLIEADERYCETIARRLAQDVLPIHTTA